MKNSLKAAGAGAENRWKARRARGVCGYELFLGKDTGWAIEGLWDDFGDPKNVSAAEFLRTNGETVLLIDKDYYYRNYWAGEKSRWIYGCHILAMRRCPRPGSTVSLTADGGKYWIPAGSIFRSSPVMQLKNRLAENLPRP